MKTYGHFNMKLNKRTVLCIILAAVVCFAVYTCQYNWMMAKAEDSFCTVYAMCKSYIIVRRTPSKNGQEVGYLECGDWTETDGTSSNGYIRVYGIGDYGEGWVYSGFITTEEPKQVDEQYVCVSNGRVACRRWMGGPKTENPWLKNGSNVQVLYEADGWALTNRGYIRSEYLEVDPR